jgi:hypothetical protein
LKRFVEFSAAGQIYRQMLVARVRDSRECFDDVISE